MRCRKKRQRMIEMKKQPKKSRRQFLAPMLVRVKSEQNTKLLAIADVENCSRANVIRMAIERLIATYDFEHAQ